MRFDKKPDTSDKYIKTAFLPTGLRAHPKRKERDMSDPHALQQPIRVPWQRTLQSVVIPDLVRRRTGVHSPLTPGESLSEQTLADLAQASLESLPSVEIKLEQLLAQGWGMEQLYLQGIAATARQLGQWWLSDQIHFASLTLAVGHLQELVLRWEGRFLRSADPLPGASRRVALLAGDFQDQHSLGLLMLQAFFKRDGWQVHPTAGMTEASLLAHVKTFHVDLLGLSVATDRRLPQTRQLIEALRQASLNPKLQVMVGGPLLMAHPEVAHDLGGDFLGLEADQASKQAFQWVERMNR